MDPNTNMDAFVKAAKDGDVYRLINFHQSGAPVDGFNSERLTALMCACSNGHEAPVRLLLSWGAKVNLTTKNGHTALMYACTEGHVSVAEVLLRNGADHKLKTTHIYDKKTALRLCKDPGKKAQIQAVIDSLAVSRSSNITTASSSSSAVLTNSFLTESDAKMLSTHVIRVEGAGFASVDGNYLFSGIFNGSGMFRKPAVVDGKNVTLCLCKCMVRNGDMQWFILLPPQGKEPGTYMDHDFYYAKCGSEINMNSLLPPTQWNCAGPQYGMGRSLQQGTLPPPNVALMRNETGAMLPPTPPEPPISDNERDACTMERNQFQLAAQLTDVTSQLADRIREKEMLEARVIDLTEQLAQRIVDHDAAIAERDAVLVQLGVEKEIERARVVEQAEAQLADRTRERDLAVQQVGCRTVERDEAVMQLASRTNEWNVAVQALADRTRERDELARELDVVAAQLASSTRARDATQQERDAAVRELVQLRLASAGALTICPFQRYRTHLLYPDMLAPTAAPGIHGVADTSPLFAYCKALTKSGGQRFCPVAGHRLVHVQAVIHDDVTQAVYTGTQLRMKRLRTQGGAHFNFTTTSGFCLDQLNVLSMLRDQFHERSPGETAANSINNVYCYHGPRREHLGSVCSTGLVAVRGTDAGFFGSGCYTTLNMEYALRYARGEFDANGGPRPTPDGRYPVVMFAATIGMAYPVTPGADYGNEAGIRPGHSDYFGRPLEPGFDCHVICVNQQSGFQAVTKDQGEYVELVFDQQSQLLPIAVLWFEEN